MPLQYLAYKFKVTQLIDISDKYLASNWENLVLQSMLFKSQLSENLCKDIDDFHGKFYDTTREEDYLSSNINKFIEQDQLLSFSIPVLYRIFQKLENDINIEKVINFLFKCLDKFGKEASILFLNIDFKQQKNKVINTLLNDYKDIFDFNMINQTLFQTTSNLTSEVAQLREEYEHNLSQMKSFFEEQRKEFIQIKRDNLEMTKKNELIMKEKEEMLKSQLNEMKCEMKNQHDYYESEFQKLKEKHEEAINHSNFIKYMQITRILISLEKFKDFPDDLKDFVIKEIIQEQLIKINNENNTFISHVLLLKNLFDNTMNSNDLLEQVNFIKNNIDHIFINLQMIETLCQRNLLKSTLNDLIYDFDDILIEQEYKSEKYEFVSNTISDLNDTYRKKRCENSNNDDSDTNCIDTNESKIKISLIIPENTLIDQNIKNKESIYKITIPSSILAIPKNSFIGCKSIRQVECDPFKTNLENAFPESQNLHLFIKLSQELETLINIDEIKGINKFKQITIPSSIKLIGNYCFYNCKSMEHTIIPSSVTSIGDYAFYNCTHLKRISIPTSVISIGSYTFQYCYKLKEITIPSSISSINDYCFSECSSLEKVLIPSSVTSIGNYSFKFCDRLVEISIPSSVVLIGDCCFYGCSSLNQVKISSSEISIGSFCFYGCSSLDVNPIPSSAKYIGNNTYNNCVIRKRQAKLLVEKPSKL